MIRGLAPSAQLVVAAGSGYFKIKLPCEETSVDEVFVAMAGARQDGVLLGEDDSWNLSSATLEEVFLQVVAAASVEPLAIAVLSDDSLDLQL